MTHYGHNGGPPLDDDDTEALLAAGLIIPPSFQSPSNPLNPAFFYGVGLRDYQHEILLKVEALMRQGVRRILIQLPTGGGKTRMAAAMLGSSALMALTGQFVVHRKELINQTSVAFNDCGLTHGFIANGRPMDVTAGIILAGIQTLVGRLGIVLPPNLAVIDECHHASSETWTRVLNHYGEAFIIGLTATPQRLDGRGLREHFDAMVVGPSVADLIRRGFLCPYEFYAPMIPDMTGVGSNAGEFIRSAAASVVDRPKIVGNIVEHYLRLAPGEQGVVFAVSREHSRHLADAFNAEGIPAMHVDGGMSEDERTHFDSSFRAGDTRIVSTVDLIGEGYDLPNISYIGDGGPSRSQSKVIQRWGRPLRTAPGKTRAIICDHAGNALPSHLGGQGHGLPDDERQWSLDGRPKRLAGAAAADPDTFSVTQCKRCFRVYPSQAKECPGCHVETPPQARVVRQVAGTLSKLEREVMQQEKTATRKAEEAACETYEQMVSLGKARGYDYPVQWAKRKCGYRRIAIPYGVSIG